MRAPLLALGLWAPPVLLMVVIWFFSAQPDLATDLGVVDLVGRKVLHFLEYALLCLLWWRALRTRLGRDAAVVAAFLLAAAYGAVDEYHQTFVSGRTGSPIDVAIDAAGAATAGFLLRRRAATRVAAG
jgi:VanZ family protein